MLPSTRTATPDFLMADLARSIRYSVRLLSKSSVAGELRYLGPRSRPFGVLLLAADDPAAEAGRVARRVADGEDDPAAEAVVGAAPALAARDEAGCLEVLEREVALLDERAR